MARRGIAVVLAGGLLLGAIHSDDPKGGLPLDEDSAREEYCRVFLALDDLKTIEREWFSRVIRRELRRRTCCRTDAPGNPANPLCARCTRLFFDAHEDEVARWVVQYRRIVERFRAFLKRQPDGVIADRGRFQLAECLLRLGESKAASRELLRVAESEDPGLAARASDRLAPTLFLDREYRGAAEHYKRTARISSSLEGRCQQLLLAGVSLFRVGDWKEAADEFKALLKALGDASPTPRRRMLRLHATLYLDHLPRTGSGRGPKEALHIHQRALREYSSHLPRGAWMSRGMSTVSHGYERLLGSRRDGQTYGERLLKLLKDAKNSTLMVHWLAERGYPFPNYLLEDDLHTRDGNPHKKHQSEYGHRDRGQRWWPIDVLGTPWAPAEPELVDVALRNLRREMLYDLGSYNMEDWDELPDPEIVETLLAAVRIGEISFTHAAIPELAQIGTPPALEALKRLLKDRIENLTGEIILNALAGERIFLDDPVIETEMRDAIKSAQESRGSLTGPTRGGISIESLDVPFFRAAARHTALRDSASAVHLLFRVAGDLPSDPKVGSTGQSLARCIVDALASMESDEAFANILDVANSSSGRLQERCIAIEALGHFENDGATEAVRGFLRSEVPLFALCAARGLGRSRRPAAVEPLLQRLREEPEDKDLVEELLNALASVGIPRDEEEVPCRYAKARDPAIRTLAYILLLHTDGPKTRVQLIEGLDDEDLDVRWTAVRVLATREGSKDRVSAVIARFGKEEDPWMRRWFRRTLQRMTGVDKGTMPEAWQVWWSEIRDGYDPKKVSLAPLVLGTGDPESTDGESLAVRSRVVLLIDISASMVEKVWVGKAPDSTTSYSAKKCAVASEEVAKILAGLPGEASFNIVWFDHETRSLWPSLRPAKKSRIRDATKRVSEFAFGYQTNLLGALEYVLKMRGVDEMILISDGKPTTGGTTDAEQILEVVAARNAEKNLKIHVIDVGGSDLLERLAEQNGGRYIRRAIGP